MADGKTHERILRQFWVIIIPLGFVLFMVSKVKTDHIYWWYDLQYWLMVYVNFALCEYIDPDLDLLGLTKSEGDVLRTFRAIHLGFLGALFISWSFIYAYIALLFGGHRSWFSHGIIVGTIGRMIWFNIPFAMIYWFMVNYSISNWGTPPFSDIGINYFWANIWLKPYIITQFIAWSIGDGVHLIGDNILFPRLYNKKRKKMIWEK